MKLVLAEKPSVAQSIAKVLGATKREDGYLEENGYVVSWCVGHLVELAQPEAYNAKYSKWTYADLPIFPMDWRYEVSAGTRKQFGILKKLMVREDVASLVCATDAGREGELIFRLVYHKAGCRKPFERLWISSMEDAAIKEGFENLRSGTEYDALYEAALCRERADWIVGINATRLFSTLYGQTLNVGRVMTPMKRWKIALIPGETVGPELIREADRLLETVSRVYDIPLEKILLYAGGVALEQEGNPLPSAVKAQASACDAVLFGSIGASRYNSLPPEQNPARVLLELRAAFGVTTNLRPVRLRAEQIHCSPLRPELIPGGFDILLVRDVRGGMLAAREQWHTVGECGQTASDLEYYDESIVEHTARQAFEAAAQRTGKLTSLDKANVLASSVLWRKTVTRIAADYPLRGDALPF